MSLHTLPWPQDVLEGLGSTQVELRVTLSYFIEPNPARRGWRTRFVYPSHQLRFDVRRAQETTLAFRSRINKAARSEARKASKEKDPGWALGPKLRHKGCLHQNVWKGIAGDLAARGVIAVYPAAGGWWRSRPKSDRWNSTARYALVVSIRTPDVAADVDIYTAVTSQLRVPVEVMPVVPSG